MLKLLTTLLLIPTAVFAEAEAVVGTPKMQIPEWKEIARLYPVIFAILMVLAVGYFAFWFAHRDGRDCSKNRKDK